MRALRASQLATDGAGAVFFTERGKTGVPVGGALSDRALAAAARPTSKALGVELHGDAYIFRNRSGAPYSSDTLGDDFRDVRHAEFGDDESRTLADFRRSGAVEAIAGDAKPEELAHAMGNTLARVERAVRHLRPGQPRRPCGRSIEGAVRRGRTRSCDEGNEMMGEKSEHDGPKSRNSRNRPQLSP